jgi:toxin ParE1/3/4
LRVALQGQYALYYTVRETEIVVVRVLHGARDHAAMAERGEFKS